MVCGFGDAVSYDRLVRSVTGERLDKTSRFTDWGHRPLTPRQIEYALADVIHLRPAYAHLQRRLEKTGRVDWLSEEMAVLNEPATYRIVPDEAWRCLKIRRTRTKLLANLRKLTTRGQSRGQRRRGPAPPGPRG